MSTDKPKMVRRQICISEYADNLVRTSDKPWSKGDYSRRIERALIAMYASAELKMPESQGTV